MLLIFFLFKIGGYKYQNYLKTNKDISQLINEIKCKERDLKSYTKEIDQVIENSDQEKIGHYKIYMLLGSLICTYIKSRKQCIYTSRLFLKYNQYHI